MSCLSVVCQRDTGSFTLTAALPERWQTQPGQIKDGPGFERKTFLKEAGK
jgi:hypothetical protein